MKHNTLLLPLAIILIVSLALAAKLAAAPLTPPAGPITTTGPIQISQQSIVSFPYSITQPGSYILTSNITNTTIARGIVISADNVFLDFNGFTFSGANISTEINRYAINVESGQTNVRIANGTITGWKGTGGYAIRAGTSGTVYIENMHSLQNNSGFVMAMKSVFRSCSATNNTIDGYTNSDHALYYNCTSFDNGQDGFQSSFRARYIDCHTIGNSVGFHLANGDAAISRCTSSADVSSFQQDGGSMFQGLRATDILAF